MILEFILFCTATILLVKLYGRRQDVLHGPYIIRDRDDITRQEL
jgi:hypothetical protein